MKLYIAIFIFLTCFLYSETIVCSNYPIQTIVRELVGLDHKIITINSNDEDILAYKPSSEEIAQSGRADIFFYSSSLLEDWTLDIASKNKVALKSLIPEDQLAILSDSLNPDFWWLNPDITILISQKISDTLIAIYPEKANKIKSNLTQFSNKLELLKNYIKSYMGLLKFHPIYEEYPVLVYFCESFDIPYSDYLYPKFNLPISPNEKFENSIKLTSAKHIIYYSNEIPIELSKIIIENKLTNSQLFPFGINQKQNYSDIIKDIAKEIKKAYSN